MVRFCCKVYKVSASIFFKSGIWKAPSLMPAAYPCHLSRSLILVAAGGAAKIQILSLVRETNGFVLGDKSAALGILHQRDAHLFRLARPFTILGRGRQEDAADTRRDQVSQPNEEQ